MTKQSVGKLLHVMAGQFPLSGLRVDDKIIDAWHMALAKHDEKAVFEAYEHFLDKGEAFPPTVGQIAAQVKIRTPEVLEIGFSKFRADRDFKEWGIQHYSVSEIIDMKEVRRVYVCKRTKYSAGDRAIEASGVTRVYLD